jgi:ribosome-associated translation inhibitor RaiA
MVRHTRFFAFGSNSMSGMKIEALIAAKQAEVRAELERDLMAMIAAIDAELEPLEERVRRLEQGGAAPEASA